jgi:hypothetical protein
VLTPIILIAVAPISVFAFSLRSRPERKAVTRFGAVMVFVGAALMVAISVTPTVAEHVNLSPGTNVANERLLALSPAEQAASLGARPSNGLVNLAS